MDHTSNRPRISLVDRCARAQDIAVSVLTWVNASQCARIAAQILHTLVVFTRFTWKQSLTMPCTENLSTGRRRPTTFAVGIFVTLSVRLGNPFSQQIKAGRRSACF